MKTDYFLYLHVSESKDDEASPVMDKITLELLQNYDNRIQAALHNAFDDIDKKHTNKIPSVELERVLNSIGYQPSVDDLEELISLSDRTNSGFIEFNDFLCQVFALLNLFISCLGSAL